MGSGMGDESHPIPEEWCRLRDGRTFARAIRVSRQEIAFFKHLFESYDGVGLIRTVRTGQDGTTIIAVLAPEDYVWVAAEVLAEVRARTPAAYQSEELPPECHEDWFLESWGRI